MLSTYQPMHIPDGFLSVTISIIFWIVSIIFIAVAIRNTSRQLGDREVPLMGILAAAIFAGQMLNFSVTGGTSGHLLGAALATIVLGPWQAILVMTTVVSVQAILFQDGGLLALGANLFNMAVVGVFVSYAIYKFLKKVLKGNLGLYLSSFVAAWGSIVLASLSCALQLALSGTSPANIAIPAMAGIHALIGLGEGLITLGAVLLIRSARQDLFDEAQQNAKGNPAIVIGGAIITLILVIISPIASSHPDGLEWVAENLGFISRVKDPFYNIIPDYVMPGIHNEAVATIIAGLIGAIVVFSVGFIASRRHKTQA